MRNCENELKNKMEEKVFIVPIEMNEVILSFNPNNTGFMKEYECIWHPFYEVIDVNMIVPDKVVEVTFIDGTKEKSVCREPDIFSLESAISICIAKKIMGGSSAYNNAVKRGMRVYKNKLKEEMEHKAERERIEKKRAKRAAYKAKRMAKKIEENAKKKEREKEEQIEIQKEAYLRAMMSLKK